MTKEQKQSLMTFVSASMERCPFCYSRDLHEQRRRRIDAYNTGFDKGVEAMEQWKQIEWLFNPDDEKRSQAHSN